MKHKAFSLTELMVVIAIVAILAAVAVPAYKRFILSARLSKVIAIVDQLMMKSILFSQTNPSGRFGNAYDLGLASSKSNGNRIGNLDTAVIASFSPYFLTSDPLRVGDNASSECGQYGYITSSLDTQALGFPSNINVFYFGCDYWHYNGVINKLCHYSYGSSTVSATDNIMPGWYNYNLTSGWDNSNPAIVNVYSTPSWVNATCQ